jgi:cytochrome d ubiquinol oxidase subunit I
MDGTVATLSQLQFAITSIYHFFFVPLTLGLSVLVAIMETIYLRTGDETWKRMTKFLGKLFLINFAMGIVTGIVQEFQFGMNWSEYSRMVGDIFGAPLAIEALLAFFLESTFLGIWIFGWDKLSKGLHAATIWLVAIGANLSAFWILVANSFMQSPTGYIEENGRLVMQDFSALLTNPYVWGQFPHTVFAGFTTGAFFIIGISAFHLLRKREVEFFKRSFRLAVIFGAAAVFLVILVGHNQTQQLFVRQPMKIAAAEAMLETENPASLSLFSVIDQKNLKPIVSIRIPKLTSLLAFNRLEGEVKGVRDLQSKYEQEYGPGNYIPSIMVAYWSFRIMVGSGFLMFFLALYALYRVVRNQAAPMMKFLWVFPISIALPYLSNTFGWILTEMGRQPWVVYSKLKTVDAFSPNLTAGMVLTSLIGFTLIYGLLMAVDIFLLRKYAVAGPQEEQPHETGSLAEAWE